MSSRLPSVATFTDPRVLPDVDPQKSPTQAATYWLRRDIVRGVFQPLERLKVEQLTEFDSVGHSPVREAILLLSGSGLVTHEHQKGHRVAPVSLDDYRDVLGDIYKRLYRLALTMAVERGGEAWEERVVLELHRSLKVKKVITDETPEARELWQRAYNRLHHEIVGGCGSPLLTKIFRELGDRLERYFSLFADRSMDLERDTHAEHRAIVDALVAGDAEKLHALLERFSSSAIRCARPSSTRCAGSRTGGRGRCPPRRSRWSGCGPEVERTHRPVIRS